MGWGVYGAGLATTMAQIVSCIFLCSRMLSTGILKIEDLKTPPSWAEVLPMLRVGSILTLRNIISFGEFHRELLLFDGLSVGPGVLPVLLVAVSKHGSAVCVV